ncbi:hypothetical protein D3C86_1458760 [compost metagenome]
MTAKSRVTLKALVTKSKPLLMTSVQSLVLKKLKFQSKTRSKIWKLSLQASRLNSTSSWAAT